MPANPKLKLVNANRSLVSSHLSSRPAEDANFGVWIRCHVTYTSNALAGNALTWQETAIVLEYGQAIAGRRFHDLCEAVGHAESYDYVMATARGSPGYHLPDTVREIHRLFYRQVDFRNAGIYRAYGSDPLRAGEAPPGPSGTEGRMSEFAGRFEALRKTAGPFELASFAHQALIRLKPFTDGNGRVARLLMNLVLVGAGYLPVGISPAVKAGYFQAVAASPDTARISRTPFFAFLVDEELKAQAQCMRLLHIPGGKADA